jgi:hypothetical protein
MMPISVSVSAPHPFPTDCYGDVGAEKAITAIIASLVPIYDSKLKAVLLYMLSLSLIPSIHTALIHHGH